MEKLQGPINPCLVAEDLEVGWLEEFISNSGNLNFVDPYNTTEDGNFCEEDYNFPNLEDKIPFLQMLQSVEPSYHHHHYHHHPFQHQQEQEQEAATFPALMQLEPNFQLLLRLQHQKVAEYYTSPSEVTHNHHHSNLNDSSKNMIIMDDLQLQSPDVKSESEAIHQVSATVVEGVDQPNKGNSTSGVSRSNKRAHLLKTSSTVVAQKEKKKRKRSTRPGKNKEEVETQRMTHIAVERNRRRQMNEHLNALRSLMPPSYVQRGDQASIIGGAIDFVKELEQMLQSLQAQKRMKQCEENGDVSVSSSSTSSSSSLHLGSFFTPFHHLKNPFHSQEQGNGNGEESINLMRKSNEEFSAEKRSSLADIEVVVIQNHVNLKIQCQRRPGQLLKAIVAFEELRLTVLHLNITSLHTLVLYSFNLKIEDDCKLATADDVARAVHQIFSLINIS